MHGNADAQGSDPLRREFESSSSPNWIAVGSLLHWLSRTNGSHLVNKTECEGSARESEFQSTRC